MNDKQETDTPAPVLSVSVANGKYTIEVDANGGLRALRYGEPWRSLTGDGMVLALVHEIERLKEERDDADSYICAIWKKDMLPCPMSERLFDRLTKTSP